MRLLDRQASKQFSAHSARTFVGNDSRFMGNDSKFSMKEIPELPTGLKIYFDENMVEQVMNCDKPKDLVTELIVNFSNKAKLGLALQKTENLEQF